MKKYFICLMSLSILLSGCTNNVPASERVEEVASEPIVKEPVVDEPIEEVDPDVEKYGPRPEFILLDEDGNYYQPKHVTLDAIVKRLKEVETNRHFKSDWDRDRFVALLLKFNGPYMDDEDVKTIYWDYLGNYGINHFDGEEWWNQDNYRSYIHLEELFIDERLSEEAKRYVNWYWKTTEHEKLADYYINEIHPNVDYSNPAIYTTIYEEMMNYIIFEYDPDKMPQEYVENSLTMNNFKMKIFKQVDPGSTALYYDIDDYKSSHIEE